MEPAASCGGRLDSALDAFDAAHSGAHYIPSRLQHDRLMDFAAGVSGLSVSWPLAGSGVFARLGSDRDRAVGLGYLAVHRDAVAFAETVLPAAASTALARVVVAPGVVVSASFSRPPGGSAGVTIDGVYFGARCSPFVVWDVARGLLGCSFFRLAYPWGVKSVSGLSLHGSGQGRFGGVRLTAMAVEKDLAAMAVADPLLAQVSVGLAGALGAGLVAATRFQFSYYDLKSSLSTGLAYTHAGHVVQLRWGSRAGLGLSLATRLQDATVRASISISNTLRTTSLGLEVLL